MSIITCPDCDVRLKLNTDITPGQRVKCPRCSSTFIPQARESAPPRGIATRRPAAFSASPQTCTGVRSRAASSGPGARLAMRDLRKSWTALRRSSQPKCPSLRRFASAFGETGT